MQNEQEQLHGPTRRVLPPAAEPAQGPPHLLVHTHRSEKLSAEGKPGVGTNRFIRGNQLERQDRFGYHIRVHDIVPGTVGRVGGAPRYWQEIKRMEKCYEIVERYDQGGSGIGWYRKGESSGPAYAAKRTLKRPGREPEELGGHEGQIIDIWARSSRLRQGSQSDLAHGGCVVAMAQEGTDAAKGRSNPGADYVALVSSTIVPPAMPTGAGEPRSWFTPEQRLSQTKETILSLLSCGIGEIYVADNSDDPLVGVDKALLPARLLRKPTYQFGNKGISELMTLLTVVSSLPEQVPILKISGRYLLTRVPCGALGNADIAGRMYRYGFAGRFRLLSTRCYFAKDSRTIETFLRLTLREVYRYHSRIVGPRSFFRICKNFFAKTAYDIPFEDPSMAIENAAARVICNYGIVFNQIQELGLSGQLAADKATYIKE